MTVTEHNVDLHVMNSSTKNNLLSAFTFVPEFKYSEQLPNVL